MTDELTYFKAANKQELVVRVNDDGFEIGITGILLDFDAPVIWYSIRNGAITELKEINKINDINYCKDIILAAQMKLGDLMIAPETAETRHGIRNQEGIIASYTRFLNESKVGLRLVLYE